MVFKVWCMCVSILIASVDALRFDLGPQTFSESLSSALPSGRNAESKEVVLYLTPSEIEALEADGAVVRPAEPENSPEERSEEGQQNEDQPEENYEQEQDQDQEQVQDDENEPEQPEQLEKFEQPDLKQENDDEPADQDLDLEEIYRIINKDQIQQVDVREQQVRNEPQASVESSEQENSEDDRQIPLRFRTRQSQQQTQTQRQDKYLAPAIQNTRSKIYNDIRYQLTEQLQKARTVAPQEELTNQNQVEQTQTVASPAKRYGLVTYEIVEQPRESIQKQQPQLAQGEPEAQKEVQQLPEELRNEQQETEEILTELLTPLLTPEKLAEVIGQRNNKFSLNERKLQSNLRGLKQSNKYNQKYGINNERLRVNLEKKNIIRKEIQKQNPIVSAKLIRASTGRKPESPKQRSSKPQPVLVEFGKHLPAAVYKTKKVASPVPVKIEKQVPVQLRRNVNKRIAAVGIKKEIPLEISNRKSQRVTIGRY